MYENDFRVIDRAVVDPLLALTWPEFLRRHRWRHDQWNDPAEFLDDFALDHDTDRDNIPRILASRTLRWTMQRSSPQLFFVETVLECAKSVSKQCPSYYCATSFAARTLFLAAAVGGFLTGRLSRPGLYSTAALLGSDEAPDCLDLLPADRKRLKQALHPMLVPTPVFPWQPREQEGDYYFLGLAETKPFLDFVRRSVSENWACPRISKESRSELPNSGSRVPTMRDSQVATQLARWLARSTRGSRTRRLCMLWHVG
jgi:hypothetical protein